ncbi:hypothetical protein ACRZHT_005534 [Citrobacter braakii]
MSDWRRADPAELAAFDPDTKVCTMNCGPHALDREAWQRGSCFARTAQKPLKRLPAGLHTAPTLRVGVKAAKAAKQPLIQPLPLIWHQRAKPAFHPTA